MILFEDLEPKEGLTLGDLTDEAWREYDFEGRVYRIEKPVGVYYREGGSTHRVVDSHGIVHCLPTPGHRGCVLRWFTQGSGDIVKW